VLVRDALGDLLDRTRECAIARCRRAHMRVQIELEHEIDVRVLARRERDHRDDSAAHEKRRLTAAPPE
jgi:hypothetical protein